MTTSRINTWIAAGLLAASASLGETLYEMDGITLEGSVRMVHRNAATCQVLAENESLEAYEQMKANHGRPLHVWRVDYSALNGSGKSLSDLTAHFQIEAEWPPCTSWTGLGQYPEPVQWAGSFETIQRPSGMQPGEEAIATAYVLAFHDLEPRFGRRQVTYRFGPAGRQSTEAQPVLSAAPAATGQAVVPEPACAGRAEGAAYWMELADRPGCYVWNPNLRLDEIVTWNAGCSGGLAQGVGTLTLASGDDLQVATGLLQDGKPEGRWVIRSQDGDTTSETFVNGQLQ